MCKAEMGTSFIVLCIQQLFPHMKTNTNKLSSRCDLGTLCHFDMEVSYYMHTHTCTHLQVHISFYKEFVMHTLMRYRTSYNIMDCIYRGGELKVG